MRQAELALCSQVDAQVVAAQPDMTAAIKLCIQVSGRDQKALYLDLGIDKGQWSRILGGKAHFPQDKLNTLCDLCANEIPLLWWALHRGYGLSPLESALEQENRKLRDELERMRRDHEVAIQLFRELRA